jgi:hypothetical protein
MGFCVSDAGSSGWISGVYVIAAGRDQPSNDEVAAS